jgi:hypothetical protein
MSQALLLSPASDVNPTVYHPLDFLSLEVYKLWVEGWGCATFIPGKGALSRVL